MDVTPVRSAHKPYVMYALFLVGYLVMAGLIVEQGRTIESQKLLIRSLFFDSTQLAALKLKEAAARKP